MRQQSIAHALRFLAQAGKRLRAGGGGTTKTVGPLKQRLTAIVGRNAREMKSSKAAIARMRALSRTGSRSAINKIVASRSSVGSHLQNLIINLAILTVTETAINLVIDLWKSIPDLLDDLTDLPNDVRGQIRGLIDSNTSTISLETLAWTVAIAKSIGLDGLAQAIVLASSVEGYEDENEMLLADLDKMLNTSDFFGSQRDEDVGVIDIQQGDADRQVASLLRSNTVVGAELLNVIRREAFIMLRMYLRND